MRTYDYYAYKLKKIIRSGSKNIEKKMAAVSAYAALSYEWNQFYTDDEIEAAACSLSERLFGRNDDWKQNWESNENAVLFYDGFGLDTRGLATIYAKALVKLRYNVIWVTTEKARGKIPTIEGLLGQGKAEIVYINRDDSHVNHAKALNEQFKKYKPARAFFYTKPDDVSAAAVFYRYSDCVTRYQINLTDHAYWLGLYAFDYCIEFRDYGAGISRAMRGIPQEKIVILPFYPFFDSNVAFQGMPKEADGKKILFSGGSLYKTMGGDNKFYKMVASVLKDNEDTVFLYAGSGDDSELKKLAKQFKDRVIHIQERKDLFALMERVAVYLNTYPMVGGLMTQYAAMAGKPPIILNDAGKQEASGLLINQESADIEFSTMGEAVAEINKLLRNKDYSEKRAEEIKKRVISEKDFTANLSSIMEGKAEKRYAECPDTEGFRHEYIGRFNKKSILNSIACKKNKSLISSFPEAFIAKFIAKAVRMCGE